MKATCFVLLAVGAMWCQSVSAQKVEPIAPSSQSGVSAIPSSPNNAVTAIGSTAPNVIAPVAGAKQNAAEKVSGTSLQSATVGALIERLRARTLTVEDAWKSGALNVDDLIYIVNERFDTWGGFNWQGDVNLRRALVKLLAENGGERVTNWPKLPFRVRLWLADYHGSVGDKRTVELAESVITELKPGAVGQEDYAFQAVERLGWFYRDTGQHEQSAQAWLRLKPLLKTPGWQVPDALIEAARAYERAGQNQQSQATYQQIIAGDNEDFAGGALWEHGNQLLARGETDAALQLLREAERKLSAEPSKKGVMSAALLGYGHYLRGDWKEARRHYQQSLTRMNGLALAQQSSVRDIEISARKMLALIEQWENKPLTSDPQRIEIKVGREAPQTAITRRFLVSMFREVPLTLKSSQAAIGLSVEDSPWADDARPLHFQKLIVVSIPPSLLAKSNEIEFAIGSPQLPKYLRRVPLKIIKANE